MMKIKFFIFAITTVALISCEKNEWTRTAPEDKVLANKAFVKVVNSVISSPTTNIFVDNKKVTGSLVGYSAQFPASTTYATVDAGARSLNILDTALAAKLNLTVNNNFEAGKYYTVFLYDTLTAAKSKVVQDEVQIPSDTVARIRFANFLYSSVAIPNMDVYSQRTKTNVFTNIPITEVTGYINHPSKLQDTFYLRATGTTTNLNSLIMTPDQKRNYTLLARGRYQTTTGTLIRTLTVVTNY